MTTERERVEAQVGRRTHPAIRETSEIVGNPPSAVRSGQWDNGDQKPLQEPGMFWYFVAPSADDKWNVFVEDHTRSIAYDSREEALRAAHRAAQANAKMGIPTGVRVKAGQSWEDDGLYQN